MNSSADCGQEDEDLVSVWCQSKRTRLRTSMSPGDVRYMNENRQTQELHQWRFGPFPGAKQLSEMYRYFWSGTVKLELVP